jgi:hypothetical protein
MDNSTNEKALDLDAIEACAKAATVGSTGIWSRDVAEDEDGIVELKTIVIYEADAEVTLIAEASRREDAAFIQAAQPSRVIALVAELRRMREERDIFAREISETSQRLGGYNGEVPLTGPQILLLLRDMEKEVINLREERDAAKASALALHHIAFPQA